MLLSLESFWLRVIRREANLLGPGAGDLLLFPSLFCLPRSLDLALVDLWWRVGSWLCGPQDADLCALPAAAEDDPAGCSTGFLDLDCLWAVAVWGLETCGCWFGGSAASVSMIQDILARVSLADSHLLAGSSLACLLQQEKILEVNLARIRF